MIAPLCLAGAAIGFSIAACAPREACAPTSPTAPAFQLGEARYRLPDASMPYIASDAVRRREAVVGGRRIALYCVEGEGPVQARSASVSFDGLKSLARQQPALSGAYQVIWRAEPGQLPRPASLSPRRMEDGSVRYQGKKVFYVFLDQPAGWSAPIGALCNEPYAAGAKTSCRLSTTAPAGLTISADLFIEDAPPAAWPSIVRGAADVMRNSKP